MRFPTLPLVGLASLLWQSVALAVTPAPIFTDHMVLQRDLPVKVWGTGEPGEKVTVSFAGQRQSATTDDAGQWSVALSPLKASHEGRELEIRGRNTITYQDVLVGEVWLCSGQSNMEKPLGEKKGQRPTDNYRSELAAADHPNLRLYHVPRQGKVKNADVQMQWLQTTPETLEQSEFSAVGYFFGQDILNNLDVPVGIIHSSFGGTMIEAWMPEQAFTSTPKLEKLFRERYFAWVKGVQASELYQSMITPVAPYTLRGFLWYQGEANAMLGEEDIYATKLEALVQSWRQVWDREDAPFYFVQLAPFNYSEWESFPTWMTSEALPRFWEVQASIDLPHTGSVVTTDLAGDAKDIHPTAKKEVGRRLANLAMVETYGRDDILAYSPTFKDFKVQDDGTVQIDFENVGDGLRRNSGNALSHFELAGKGRNFEPAEARLLDKDTVVVSSSLVRHPEAVRFAWHETATPNLVNSAGLPAQPFRTDSWPVQMTRPKPTDVATLGWDAVPQILERIQAPTFPNRDFKVTDYGAKGDGKADNTDAIRKAIKAAHEAGGGRVVIPEGTFMTGAVHLLSNVNLHVSEGATLRFIFDENKYFPLVHTRYEGTEHMGISPLIYAFEQENIAITGKGTLDGSATPETWWGWDWNEYEGGICKESKERLLQMGADGVPVEDRVFGPGSYLRPNFIQPYRCKNVLIEGVKIVRSPMWIVHPVLSENVTVRGLHIESHGPNNDGCNPESSRDVLIEETLFDTGDDCIAIKSGKNNDGRRVGKASENIIVRNCRMKEGHGGVVLGSEVSGDIRNVFVENCLMDSPHLDRALRFKSNTVRGGIVENIYMRDVEVGQTVLGVVTANFMYDHRSKGPHQPVVRNVHVERVTSHGSPRVMSIVGIPEGVIDGIHFRDCTFTNITHPDIVKDAGQITFENVIIEPKAEK
ncbi:MAG: sialate O-acetylesterase [Verrucomicrobiota bacterium JB022]|nr:sialate O-acetylesterase [Verrucomicrobiota bacterium JB022]